MIKMIKVIINLDGDLQLSDDNLAGNAMGIDNNK